MPLEALARALHGKPYRGRAESLSSVLLTKGVGKLPGGFREKLYRWAGSFDATPARNLDRVDAEEISRWAVNSYPRRRYPAVMIGSSNGAAMHLCAALGIPWLPQTVLVPVRRTLHPDEPEEDLAWGKEPARRVTERNPELRVYQMHDPNQDRLMLYHMAYFRLKRLRLGEVYETFLRDTLPAGATLLLLECDFRWPSTRVSDRHTFQFGGYGGVPPREYFEGSARIREYLKRRGSPVEVWRPPEPTDELPEAEWGFDPELRADVKRFAKENGYRVRRIRFRDPAALSPLVADLYRWWYRRLERPSDRLLVESFIFLQPFLTFRTGSVPYWAVFNSYRSVDDVNDYLANSEPFDDILLTLFSNSVEAAGIAPIEAWRSVLRRAKERGRFVGVNEREYPKDLTSFVRHYKELERLDQGLPRPEPLTLERFDAFLSESRAYPVEVVVEREPT